MGFGAKLSLPGYDVATATPEQCVFHSSYPSPKVRSDAVPAHYGRVTITFANDPTDSALTTLYILNHGYTYTPSALAAATYTDSMFSFQGNLPLRPADSLQFYLQTNSTQMKVAVYWISAGWGTLVGASLDLSFYLFAESGL